MAELQQKLNTLLVAHRERRGPSRAQIIRVQLMEEVRPVRSLLTALAQQPWKGSADHPVLESLKHLNALYDQGEHVLPVDTDLSLGRVWRKSLRDEDREKVFAAAEVGTLLNLRRALRNGSVWIDHSFSFRRRETLFIPPARWQTTRRAHYRRLRLPQDPAAFLEPLIERASDPLHEAMVQVGKLLRTVFLCDYFVNEAFRRELLRVLNRGEAVNALKRSIYVDRVSTYQAKQHEEMQAVADALSRLANLVMAWNTMKMQSVLDRWNARLSTAVPPQLIGRIAPTRTEGINLRGVFTFPIEQYQTQLLPSLPAAKSRAFGG